MLFYDYLLLCLHLLLASEPLKGRYPVFFLFFLLLFSADLVQVPGIVLRLLELLPLVFPIVSAPLFYKGKQNESPWGQ